MKVGDNTLGALRDFFMKECVPVYGEGESQSLFRIVATHRFRLPFAHSLPVDMRLSESDLLFFFYLVKRLKKFEPVQYILQEAHFYGLTLKVTPACLIPRPETEELVHLVLAGTSPNQQQDIADLCSGSGCIALALKKHLPLSRIIGYELSSEALELSKTNARNLQLEVNFENADILDRSFTLPQQDIIVSNPPYIGQSEKPTLLPNVLEYEPHLALFSPVEDALIFYRRLSEIALTSLKPEGKLYVESSSLYAAEVAEIFRNSGLKEVRIIKDVNGHDRMVKASL